MKTLPAAALALLAVLSVTAAAPAAAQARTLVVSTYGLNGDLLKKHVYDPFKARCGCELVIETGNVAQLLDGASMTPTSPAVAIRITVVDE